MNAVIFNRAAAAAGILALAFAVLVGGASQSTAEGPSETECQDAFDDSSASTYCPNPSISVSDSKCDVSASCSVTVTLNFSDADSVERTYTPSLSAVISEPDLERMNVCFGKNSAGKWGAYVVLGCRHKPGDHCRGRGE